MRRWSQRTDQRHALRAQGGEYRFDDFDFLVAKQARFAGMRIESEHRDAGRGEAALARLRCCCISSANLSLSTLRFRSRAISCVRSSGKP